MPKPQPKAVVKKDKDAGVAAAPVTSEVVATMDAEAVSLGESEVSRPEFEAAEAPGVVEPAAASEPAVEAVEAVATETTEPKAGIETPAV